MCERLEARVVACAVDLMLGERDATLEIALVALLQERVGEHVQERRRERDGDAVGTPSAARSSKVSSSGR